MKIVIGADIVLDERNQEKFASGKIEEVIGRKLLQTISDADLRIFNLEAPLTDGNDPILKCGPCFKTNPSAVNGFKQLNVDLFCIGNNHIRDYGDRGVTDTIRLLQENQIDYVGGGPDLTSAEKGKIIFSDGVRIGIFACAEHEFSIAGKQSAGANPFDPLESFEAVAQLAKNCDYVLVLYHGGKEYYRYPSPWLRKVCHKFVRSGASLVICQHSHCIGAKENYQQGEIVYGQGNFLMTDEDNEYYKTGLLTVVLLEESGIQVDYIPICQTENGVDAASAQEAVHILEAFETRSRQILEEGFVVAEYAKFADKMLGQYYKVFAGNKLWHKILWKLWGNRFLKQLHNADCKRRIYDFILCEAHRELLLEGMKRDTNS